MSKSDIKRNAAPTKAILIFKSIQQEDNNLITFILKAGAKNIYMETDVILGEMFPFTKLFNAEHGQQDVLTRF